MFLTGNVCLYSSELRKCLIEFKFSSEKVAIFLMSSFVSLSHVATLRSLLIFCGSL